jgi:hypothetical protein
MAARRLQAAIALGLAGLVPATPARATDHNDPDKINSIFPDIDPSPADIYGLMAWPEDEQTLAVVLTWADVDYDRDILYQIKFDADRPPQGRGGWADLGVLALLGKLSALVVDDERTISFRFGRRNDGAAGEPEVAVELRFDDFGFEQELYYFPVETEVALPVEGGEDILAFVGRRDDPFFIDLLGFFDSIWYGHPPGPQTTWGVEDKRRSKGLFRHDESGALVTNAQGRPQLVYDSDNDEQAGLDVHAMVLRIPKHMLADDEHPIVNVWSETRKVGG